MVDDSDPFAPRLETDIDIIPDFYDGEFFILPDQSLAATINGPLDEDAFGADLEAGKTYIASIVGIGPQPLEWASLSYSFDSGASAPQAMFFDQRPFNSALSQQPGDDASITLFAHENTPFFGQETKGGNYLLSFIEADNIESNSADIAGNTIAGAVDFNLNGAVLGYVNSIGDVDYYRLNFPSDASFVLSLYQTGDSGTLEPSISVYTENGDSILSQSTSSDGNEIKLTSFGGNSLIIEVSSTAGETGEYVLSAVQIYDVVACGTGTTATIEPGVITGGSLESAADQDWYGITLDSSVNYKLKVDGSFFSTGIESPTISIYAANGNKITDYTFENFSSSAYGVEAVFNPPSSGDYFIAVSKANTGEEYPLGGDFTLAVTETSEPADTGELPDLTNPLLSVSVDPLTPFSERDASINISYSNLQASEDIPAILVVDGFFGQIEDPSGGFSSSVALFSFTQDSGCHCDPDSDSFPLNVQNLTDWAYSPTSTYTVSLVDPNQAIDWQAQEASLRPNFVSDGAWEKTFANFLDDMGTTVLDLSQTLAKDAHRLGDIGGSEISVSAALQFELEQAGDFGTLAERAQTGSLGQGWSSLADIELSMQESNNGFCSWSITGLPNVDALKSLNALQTAQYAVSLSVGKVVGQDGQIIDANFNRPIFVNNADATAMVDGNMRLVALRDGYQILTDEGDQFLFDRAGKLTSYISNSGEEIVALYDAASRITRYERATGDFLEFTYDSDGNVAEVLDGNGRHVIYNYSADGSQLLSIADDAGETVFTYDIDGNLLTTQRIGGPELAFSYDSNGRLESQTLGGAETENYAYDEAGAITATNGAGEETVIQLAPGGGVARLENNLGQSVSITHDAAIRTTTIETADGAQTLYSFDSLNRLQSITDGNSDSIFFDYDSTNHLTRFTDSGGNAREYEYDSAGRLLNAEWSDGTALSYEYDALGNLVEITNRRGDSTQLEFDALGHVTTVSDSASGSIAYTYDARGNVTSITTQQGITQIAYDSADRVTLIEYPNSRSLAYDYDAAGRRVSMINQDGEGTFYAYDAAGRLASVANNDGILTSYSYDAAGRLSIETNRNGTETEYGYNGAGLLESITNRDANGNISSFFQYGFDVAGKCISAVTQDGEWAYEYDGAGQLVKADFISTSPDAPNTSLEYQYDAAGNRIGTIENGVTTDYATNLLNQYTTAGDKSFAYDADGNMISQAAPENNYNYVYDIDNRLIEVTKPDGTVISYEYDAFGNRSAITENGVRTEFLIDPFGFGNAVAEYDQDGAKVASYTHGLGLASRENADGSLAFFDADATGSVTGLTDDTGNLVNRYAYTPFGDELYEMETFSNDFEFNGAFGITEDAENLLYMRARSYDVETGRFLSEDPLYFDGDVGNLYRFAYNDPVEFGDPNGESPALFIGAAFVAYGSYKLGEKLGMYGVVIHEAMQTDDVNYQNALGRELVKDLVWLPTEMFAELTGLGAAADFAVDANKIVESVLNSRQNSSSSSTTVNGLPEDKGYSAGDPHYRTFDGLAYEFQAAGEFVLVRSVDGEFEVQVRQEPWPDRTVSLNTAAAALINGTKVEIHADSDGSVIINGCSVMIANGEGIAIGDGYIVRNDASYGISYLLTDANGNGARIDTYQVGLNVQPFLVGGEMAGKVEGLLGNNDENIANDLALDDGTLLPNPVPTSMLYGEYADSWRVTDETTLFTYSEGKSTETFTNRDFPGVVITLDDLDPAARAAAEQIALDAGLQPGTYEFNSAVLDIALTGINDFIPSAEIIDVETPSQEIEIQLQPVTGDDTAATDEDTAITVDVLANDSDPENDPLTLLGGIDANGGTVSVVDNKMLITPASDFFGDTTVTYSVSDGQGNISTGKLDLSVTSVNDAPEAAEDSFTINEDSTLQGNVLEDNGFGVDRDLDSDSLSVIPADIITANGGSIMLLANGDFIYTPAANFSGPDGFEYTLSDGNGAQATGTVSITVSAVNDGPDAKNDQFVTDEDSALSGNLLSDNGNGTDSDIDGNPLNVVAGTFATLHGGSVEVLENGQFTYTPAANFNGSDSFDYTLSDGQGGSDIATASILVNSVNDSPEAKDDLFTGTENHEIEGNLLTDNGFGADIDLDGNVLRVVQDMVSSTAGGSVILMANGDFVYMPPSGFVGTDTFDYTVADDLGGSASATVTMTINPALNIDPVAQDDQFETTLLSSITGNVLNDNDHGADSDIDGDTLSVQPAILFTENGGMVSINTDGTFVYTPATGFVGNDRFDYTVLDGQGGQDIGTVTVAVSVQPDQIIGTSGNDVLKGDNHDNTILAMAGNDTLKGKNGADLLVGGEGNDILYGSNGNDILVGGDVLMSQRHFSSNNVAFPNLAERVGLGNLAPPGTQALGVIDGDLTSAAATTATITFLSTGAGYNNSLGVYNIGADGTIQNVELAFTNVKKESSGSAHTVELPGAPDSDFGFFIIADGARQNSDFKKLDLEHGDLNFYYHFGQADERLAKVTDDGDDISLVFSHGNKETVIRGDVYHTTERDADPILNADEHTHAVSGFADASDTTNLRIGFEDLRNTGDADYNDVVFDLSYAPTFTGTTTPDGNDILHGGNGDDLLIGGKGNDTLYGDKGADTFKFLSADDGTDTIKDFRLSQGDKIDIAEVLEDYDPVSDILSQFVEVTQQGCDTVLSVDSDGGGDNFVALAIIQGNTHLDVQAMVSNGNLVI